ncbi:membrane protein [Psychromonas marina]|uniref:Membrane protein n=1 Tax=Psychromonas marina TaxID=88364 RepID=A0ABQ6E1L8_9GAMM|nr:OmpA family protein [Psychromonas marina]GLS91293.1 membrane protein [Psychromonas marina]
MRPLIQTTVTAVSLAVLLTTSGCSSKPPQGKGGLAEHDYSNQNNDYSNAADHPIGLENAVYFEQQLSQRHLDALLAAGANTCFPASITTIKIRQARIARQLQGGLELDAVNDLIIQRDQLSRLERRLNYVQLQDSCLPSDSYNGNVSGNIAKSAMPMAESNQSLTALSEQQLKEINALLNNNNQFVINSTALNPRYIGQLSEATQLLRAHPQYHLKLTGHADSKGDPAENVKLSLARASQVERYLLIFGLSPNNIEVNGSGSNEPLFSDDQPQVRLVNRRVSIELINANNSPEVTPK